MMNTYIISFELHNTSQNQVLSAIILVAKSFLEIHKNMWIFTSDVNFKIIEEVLVSSVTGSDRLFFSRVIKPYSGCLNTELYDYIEKENLI